MKFFKRETCEKLVSMGCVSVCDFHYILKHRDRELGWIKHPFYNAHEQQGLELLPAFTELDFLGSSAQAKKNAEIVFGYKREEIKGYSYGCTRDGDSPWEYELEPLDNLEDDIKKPLLEKGFYSPTGSCCHTYHLLTETVNNGSAYCRHEMMNSDDGIAYLEKYLEEK